MYTCMYMLAPYPTLPDLETIRLQYLSIQINHVTLPAMPCLGKVSQAGWNSWKVQLGHPNELCYVSSSIMEGQKQLK